MEDWLVATKKIIILYLCLIYFTRTVIISIYRIQKFHRITLTISRDCNMIWYSAETIFMFHASSSREIAVTNQEKVFLFILLSAWKLLLVSSSAQQLPKRLKTEKIAVNAYWYQWIWSSSAIFGFGRFDMPFWISFIIVLLWNSCATETG